jgi:hypothetical protein
MKLPIRIADEVAANLSESKSAYLRSDNVYVNKWFNTYLELTSRERYSLHTMSLGMKVSSRILQLSFLIVRFAEEVIRVDSSFQNLKHAYLCSYSQYICSPFIICKLVVPD